MPETRSEATPGVDLARLSNYLATTRPGMVDGPLRARLITGGKSNLTYEITDGESTWILRRPPLGHVLATAHDILSTLAFMSYLNLEVGLVVVAALLTVLGYSLNDKIVIFDRVRENLKKYRRQNLFELLNLSINETIPRTLLTGGTTIATALVLSFFAGAVIRPFALVMSFGIIIGTWSSMFIASPILFWIEQRWPGKDARGARVLTGSGGQAPAPAAAPVREPHKPQPAR